MLEEPRLTVRKAFQIYLVWAIPSIFCSTIPRITNLPFLGLLSFLVCMAGSVWILAVLLRLEIPRATGITLLGWATSIALAVLFALPIRVFCFQAFTIPTQSMSPALLPGDRVMVSKLAYRSEEPKRWDIAVFRNPDTQKKFVKRVVGLPGENVEFRGGKILINGSEVQLPPQLSKVQWSNAGEYGRTGAPVLVPASHYYFLGDVSSSRDSRYYGFIPRKDIVGKVLWIYDPPARRRRID